jgi:threonine dehydrogenase-like Zn-dependent dehydrogenase
LMANKRIDMTPAITARYPLERAAEGIPAASDGKNAKVLIVP